ncbi:MAG: hypothetical protein AAF658_07120 [Myxococcota bacterium]
MRHTTPVGSRLATLGTRIEMTRMRLPLDLIDKGVAEFKDEDIELLKSAPSVDRTYARAVENALHQTGREMMRRDADGTFIRRFGESLTRADAPRSMYQALAMMDLVRRLDSGRRDLQARPAMAVASNDIEGPVLEYYFSWTHDERYMGDGFGPSGYRLHFCSNAAMEYAECDQSYVVKQEFGPAEPNSGRRYVRLLGEADVNAGTDYSLFATAYNTSDGVEQSSLPSNRLDVTLVAANRGDMNRNGAYDWGDVEILLERLETPERPWVLADLNRDGDVTTDDLEALVNAVVGE